MIMMIDDDSDTLEIYRLLVEKTDYASYFLTFGSVASALDYLANNADPSDAFPRYILLDLSMPGQNGLDFIRLFEERYASLYPDTKIVILTSSVRESEHQEALAFDSVTQVVSKPLPKQLLIDLLAASVID